MRHAIELAVRALAIAAGGAIFAYTALNQVTQLASAGGGAALILGLYFGLTPWSRLKALVHGGGKGRHSS